MDDQQQVDIAAPGSGWERLRLLFQYAYSHALKKEPEDEQLRPAHELLNAWASGTLLATCIGIPLGAVYQWIESGKELASSGGMPQDQALAKAVAQERRASVLRAGIKGGLRLGGLAAVFYGAEMLAAVYQNRHGVVSHTVGSAASAALLGYSVGGVQGAAFGAAAGVALGAPSGLVWDKFQDWTLGQQRGAPIFAAREATVPSGAAKPGSSSPTSRPGLYDSAALLEQLESSLSQQRQQRQQQQLGRHKGEQQQQQ